MEHFDCESTSDVMRWLQSEAAVLWPARAVAAQGDRVQQCAVVEASSSPASSFTFGQMASTASATAACSPARTAPRRSRERVRSWVWPRRWPRRRSRSIPRRRRCLPRLARAVAAACSSSGPSRLAARHATADRNEDRYLMGETATVRTRITKGSPRWSTSVGSGTLLWSCLCQRPRRS